MPFITSYHFGKDNTLTIVRVIHGEREWRDNEWPM
jgi:hypothetical protein